MSNCLEKIKTDECIQTRDDGYEDCNKWADEGSNQCTAWDRCKWYTPWECIAGFFCKAWYWVANVVCKGYHWVSNIICVAWKYITKFICVVVDIISSIINVIAAIIDIIISIVGGIIGFIVDLILSIPYIGRFVGWIINIVKGIVGAVLSIPDIVLGIFGIFPEKKLKLLVIIQKDNRGNPIVQDLEIVYRAVQFLINTFRVEMNVRVMPVKLLQFKTAFSDDNYSLKDFVKVDDGTSDYQTLDVCCDSCAAGEDLASNGSIFNLLMARVGFLTSGRRLIGYGSPVIAFAVRSFKDGKEGCSLGPLADYITVKFNEQQSGIRENSFERLPLSELTPDKLLDSVTVLAHEVAHACNLPHCCDFPSLCCNDDNEDGNNIMKGAPKRKGELNKTQKIFARSSRHITYS